MLAHSDACGLHFLVCYAMRSRCPSLSLTTNATPMSGGDRAVCGFRRSIGGVMRRLKNILTGLTRSICIYIFSRAKRGRFDNLQVIERRERLQFYSEGST